ncbi:aminopeptidase [Candidatus Bathyarchaeota archaeon]|nr:aminopeptidase [Candidatus Bathyarchaeota archaeon]
MAANTKTGIEPMDAVEAARNALVVTKGATMGESMIIYCDPEQHLLGEMFADAGISLGLWTRLVMLDAGDEVRKELDDRTKEALTSGKPDIIVNVFRTKGGETSYRIKFMRIERRKTNRIVHCPGISLDMFTEGAAALTEEEYAEMFAFGDTLKDVLKGAHKVHVTCGRGSDFTLDLGGKDFIVEQGTNIPTGEINVMPPIGDSFEGKLVSTSGGTGKLYRDTPAEIYSKDGLAGEVKCKDRHVRDRILEELNRDAGARYLGEFAIGINRKARVVDAFVEAEKVVSTIHVAFGGSYRPSKTHLDLLIENPTVTIHRGDGTSFTLMERGEFKV